MHHCCHIVYASLGIFQLQCIDFIQNEKKRNCLAFYNTLLIGFAQNINT